VTATHTQGTGYVTGGTTTETLTLTTQAAKTVTPTESVQNAVAANVYTTGIVKVGAISKTYVGSDISQRSSTDITASGDTVTVPEGYYAASASKTVASATHPKPTLSLASTTGIVTASHTQSAGYVAAGTTSETLELSTQAGKTVTPTEAEQTAVAAGKYTLGAVKVGAISKTYVGSSISQRSSTDITASGDTVTVPEGYYASASSKTVASATHANPTATINSTTGVVTASHTQTAGYVAAGTTTGTLELSTQAAKTVTPTESEQTAVAAGKYTTGAVKVGAISKTYVGSSITRRSSTDLTASGDTVTVPEGYYASAASKTITAATHANPTASINNSTGLVTASHTQAAGYVSAGTTTGTLQLTTQAAKTVTPTESEQTAVAANVFTTGIVKVGAISNTYVGSGIARKTSSDLTSTDLTVTVPAGYYANSGSYTLDWHSYLEFTNKELTTSNWTASTTYKLFPRRASIACTGVTADMFPYVEFSEEDSQSGYFSSVAETYAGGVYIYAAEPKAVTIPKITVYKRS